MCKQIKQMSESTEKAKTLLKKRFPRYNYPFILFTVVCCLISVISICLSACGYDCAINDPNDLGVACQVVTALVCCITSIIAISFSLQDSDFFGIKTKDLNCLRVEKRFSYRCIVLISIVLVFLNLASYMFQLTIASLGIAMVAILFCAYIAVTEVPLMTKEEKAGISILQHRIISGVGATDVFASKFDDALKYLLLEKNLKTTFEILAAGDQGMDIHKRYVMSKLLDVQADMAWHVKEIENKAALAKTVGCIGDNIRDLKSFNLDLTSVYGDDFPDTKHYIIRAILGIAQCDEGRETARNLACGILTYIDFMFSTADEKTKRDYLISIFFSVCTSYIRQGEIDFLEEIKREYSNRSYALSVRQPSTTIFALISMYLYYLCEVEGSVPADVKQKIKCAMEENESGYTYHSVPWCVLFQEFLSAFPVDFSEFQDLYFQNEQALEYVPADGQGHWIIMNRQFALNWYLTILFGSMAVIDFDYSKLNVASDSSFHYYIDSFKRKCFDENRAFQETDDMRKIMAFFGGNSSFTTFKSYESATHSFFDFANQLKIADMKKEAEETAAVSNDKLAEQYKESIISTLQAEWGFKKNVELQGAPKYLRLVFEKSERIINRDEAIVDATVRSIYQELRRNTPMEKWPPKTDLEDELIAIMNNGDEYKIVGGPFRIEPHIKEPGANSSFREWMKNVERVESKILPYSTLVKSGGFSFNFSIDELSVTDLPQETLSNQVEQSKRPDGQYVYDGVFMSREDLESILFKTRSLFFVKLRYQISTEKGAIIHIDYAPQL